MMDFYEFLVWIIPSTVILGVGIFFIRRALRNPSVSHDRAEIMCGVGLIIASIAVLRLSIMLGDIISTLLIMSSMFITTSYGIEHVTAKRIEREKGMLKAPSKRVQILSSIFLFIPAVFAVRALQIAIMLGDIIMVCLLTLAFIIEAYYGCKHLVAQKLNR